MSRLLDSTPLGKTSEYISVYSPELLSPIPRAPARNDMGLTSAELPFDGADLWTAYEISWLNRAGKPLVALGYFAVPCESPCLIESKSLKLYLNSFNQSHFDDVDAVQKLIQADLSKAADAPVKVELELLHLARQNIGNWTGEYIDHLDLEIDEYQHNPDLLRCASGGTEVEESLYSHLLKSNCPVTGQPDWASLLVKYQGKAIDREALLRYIISFREHEGFHESCVEQIFMDIMERCGPRKLTVAARYTRRGGLDINPFRSNCADVPEDVRLLRQ